MHDKKCPKLTGLTGRIVLPNDSQYNTARQEFNTFFNRYPLVIVFAQETKEMVNADGCLLHANSVENADLFWALRGGGGGNFGICTSFCFRTHQIDTVAYAEINWDLQELKPVLQSWQKYTLPCSDKRLTPLLTIASGESTLLLMQGVFLGSSDELQKLLNPLLVQDCHKRCLSKKYPGLRLQPR